MARAKQDPECGDEGYGGEMTAVATGLMMRVKDRISIFFNYSWRDYRIERVPITLRVSGRMVECPLGVQGYIEDFADCNWSRAVPTGSTFAGKGQGRPAR